MQYSRLQPTVNECVEIKALMVHLKLFSLHFKSQKNDRKELFETHPATMNILKVITALKFHHIKLFIAFFQVVTLLLQEALAVQYPAQTLLWLCHE